jgi:peptidoglycan/xylan/chitin deacetylase (PgdA/CDA1 family)
MNILYLLSQVEITGAETYVEALASYYSTQGNNIFIASDTFSRNVNAQIFKVPLHQRDFKTRHNNILEIREIIRENKIDIVHANSRASAWVGHFASKRENIPFVVSVHGLSGMRFSKKLVPALGDKTIPVSEYLRDVTKKDFNLKDEQLRLIRNGINIEVIVRRSKTEVKTIYKKDKDFVLAYIGRATGPKKDIVLSIVNEIAPKVKNEISNLKVLLICPGQLDIEIIDSINKVNKTAGENYIIEDDHNNDVMATLNQADLVIAAGRSAIESVVLDKPVIYWGESLYGGLLTERNKGNALETNFGDCFVVHKADYNKIANEIITAIKKNVKLDEDLKSIIENEYKLENVAEKIYSLYKEVIKKRNIEILKKPLPIVLYHRVLKEDFKESVVGIYITEKKFEEHLLYIKERKYSTLTFFDISKAINGEKSLPEKSIILTFDDGYDDNYSVAFPLLKKYGSTAVIFLVTACKNNAWDKKQKEPTAVLMSEKEIMEMYDYGIEFGAHTLNHVNLNKETIEKSKEEIVNSKQDLINMGIEVKSFAYPYGECNAKIKTIVKEAEYEFGVATDSGPLNILEDLYQIRRQIIFSHTSFLQFKKKISRWYPAYKKFKSKK